MGLNNKLRPCIKAATGKTVHAGTGTYAGPVKTISSTPVEEEEEDAEDNNLLAAAAGLTREAEEAEDDDDDDDAARPRPPLEDDTGALLLSPLAAAAFPLSSISLRQASSSSRVTRALVVCPRVPRGTMRDGNGLENPSSDKSGLKNSTV